MATNDEMIAHLEASRSKLLATLGDIEALLDWHKSIKRAAERYEPHAAWCPYRGAYGYCRPIGAPCMEVPKLVCMGLRNKTKKGGAHAK